MATGTGANFVIYENEVWTAFQLKVTQMITAFNEASRGALTLRNEFLKGNFDKRAFFNQATAIARRDITSTASVADTPLTQDEDISVKLNRRIGPLAQTLDAWKKVGASPEMLSQIVGEFAAEQATQEMINELIAVLVSLLENTAATTLDVSAGSTTNYTDLNLTNALMGDHASKIVAYVMHSKAYADLVGDSISKAVTNVTDTAIFSDVIGSFGRIVVVTDAPALTAVPVGTVYKTLALTMGAGVSTMSEPENLVSEVITGSENLIGRVQGEYAYNLGIRGWKYSSATVNPDDATVQLETNWTELGTSVKQRAGAILIAD